MKSLRWVRRVIADRGEHEAVAVDLERTPEGGYAFRLGVRAGFDGQEAARIPVSRRVNPSPHPVLKEIHVCEVAGRTLEAANVHALRAKVARQLEVIAPSRTLPLCYFRVPAMEYELPVYEEGGWLRSPVIGGPSLRARDLAGIRRHVCRYLTSAGYVHGPEEVAVGVLRPSDLRRVPPAAVIRSAKDSDLWLPSVEGVSAEGPVVGLLGHAARLRRSSRLRTAAGPSIPDHAPAAPDVLGLLRLVRQEVATPEALYAAEVRPEIWATALAQTEATGAALVAHLADEERTKIELPMRRTGAGDLAIALEDRGITAFLARDEAALADAVAAYLAVHDFLRFRDDVEVASIPKEALVP